MMKYTNYTGKITNINNNLPKNIEINEKEVIMHWIMVSFSVFVSQGSTKEPLH